MILCEYVEANRHVYSVRGIGATLDRATYLTGDMQVIWASLAAMVLLIVLVNRFFWDALYAHTARRYTVERWDGAVGAVQGDRRRDIGVRPTR